MCRNGNKNVPNIKEERIPPERDERGRLPFELSASELPSHPLHTAAVFDFSISVKPSVRHMKACRLYLHLKAQCYFPIIQN